MFRTTLIAVLAAISIGFISTGVMAQSTESGGNPPGPCENCGGGPPPPCEDCGGPPPGPCEDCGGPPPPCEECGPPPPCADCSPPPPCAANCGPGTNGDPTPPTKAELGADRCNAALGRLRKVTPEQVEAFSHEAGVTIVPVCNTHLFANVNIDDSQALQVHEEIAANGALAHPLAQRGYVPDHVVGIILTEEAAVLYVHKV